VIYKLVVGTVFGIAIGNLLARLVISLPAKSQLENTMIGLGSLCSTLFLYGATGAIGREFFGDKGYRFAVLPGLCLEPAPVLNFRGVMGCCGSDCDYFNFYPWYFCRACDDVYRQDGGKELQAQPCRFVKNSFLTGVDLAGFRLKKSRKRSGKKGSPGKIINIFPA
jgi:hypothetical protein